MSIKLEMNNFVEISRNLNALTPRMSKFLTVTTTATTTARQRWIFQGMTKKSNPCEYLCGKKQQNDCAKNMFYCHLRPQMVRKRNCVQHYDKKYRGEKNYIDGNL